MALVDGFEDGDISEYSGNTSPYSVVSSPTWKGSYAVEVENSAAITTKSFTVNVGETPFSMFGYVDSASSPTGTSWSAPGFYFGVQTLGDKGGIDGYRVDIGQEATGLQLSKVNSDGTMTGLATSSYDFSAGQWVELAVTTWDSSGNIAVEARDSSGNVLDSLSATDTSYGSGGIGWLCEYQAGAPSIQLDYYTKTESSGSPPSAPSGLTAVLS